MSPGNKKIAKRFTPLRPYLLHATPYQAQRLVPYAILFLFLLCIGWLPAEPSASPTPADAPQGLIIHKKHSWHDASKAEFTEFVTIESFSTMTHLTTPSEQTRHIRTDLIFEAIFYEVPADTSTEDFAVESNKLREKMIAAMRKFPPAQHYLLKRVPKELAVTKPSPTPAPSATPVTTPDAPPPAWADFPLIPGGSEGAIEYNDGTTLHGRIINITPQHVVLTIPHPEFAGVLTEKRIPHHEIRTLTAESLEDRSFQTIEDFLIPSTSVTLDAYRALVQNLSKNVQKFRSEFPQSTHLTAAETKLQSLTADLHRMTDTQSLKYQNEWVSGTFLTNNEARYRSAQQLSSAEAFLRLQQPAEALQSLEEAFNQGKTTRTMIDLAESAPAILQGIQTIQNNTDTSDPAAARAARNIERQLKSLQQKISSIPLAKIQESFAAVDQAKQALAQQDFSLAENALKDAKTSWSQNVEISPLQEELTTAMKKAKAAEEITPSPYPGT